MGVNTNQITLSKDISQFLLDYALSLPSFRAGALIDTVTKATKCTDEALVRNMARLLINQWDGAGRLNFDLTGWWKDIRPSGFKTSYQDFIVETVRLLAEAKEPSAQLNARVHAIVDIFGEEPDAPHYTDNVDTCWRAIKRTNAGARLAGYTKDGRHIVWVESAAQGYPPLAPNWEEDIAFSTSERIAGATNGLGMSIALILTFYAQVSSDLRKLGAVLAPLQPDYANVVVDNLSGCITHIYKMDAKGEAQ